MNDKKIFSVGVVGSKNNKSYYFIKKILINSGYNCLYDSSIISILENGVDFVIIFEITPILVEKMVGLSLKIDIIILAGLNTKDYKNIFIRKMAKTTRYLIMNIDDEESINILDGEMKGLVITYGQNKKATVTISSLDLDGKIKFNFCIQREFPSVRGSIIEPLETPITIDGLGMSNVYHGLAAITFGFIYEIDILKIQGALSKLNNPDKIII